MALFSKTEMENYADQFIRRDHYDYSTESARLDESIMCFSAWDDVKEYDIFLSHSSSDKKAAFGIANSIKKKFNYSVYIDLQDDALDASKVSHKTADILRNRMKKCKCLFYATSQNTVKSKWMPWETGYMDALTGRVAICPLVENDDNDNVFNGQEYLGLYPYVSYDNIEGIDQLALWINRSANKYVDFDSWIKGKNPYIHT